MMEYDTTLCVVEYFIISALLNYQVNVSYNFDSQSKYEMHNLIIKDRADIMEYDTTLCVVEYFVISALLNCQVNVSYNFDLKSFTQDTRYNNKM